jgi:hypothetical protein
LTQKRQALVRSEKDKRISELMKFGQSFKVRGIITLGDAISDKIGIAEQAHSGRYCADTC